MIDKLDLKPHPEGGSYREIYRSSERVQTVRAARSAITPIYYLLERNQISRWHVVEADEIWHALASRARTRTGRPATVAMFDGGVEVDFDDAESGI